MSEPLPGLVDRELSWLSFNGRVLEEAADPAVPLLERVQFLAIFSSNLDEFFRVRVAALRSLLRLGSKRRKKLSIDPQELLEQIHRTVHQQQERYGELIREVIFPQLATEGLHLIGPDEIRPEERPELARRFRDEVLPLLTRHRLRAHQGDEPLHFIEDRQLHLVVAAGVSGVTLLPGTTTEYELVSIPSPPLDRFVSLHRGDEGQAVLFLDDLVRLHLPEIIPGATSEGAWAIKLTRDAELHLEDEFQGDLVAAMRKALAKRGGGPPSRFLFDASLPAGALELLRLRLGLQAEDLIQGGRYHNLHDLRDFPTAGRRDLRFPPWPAAPHPELGPDRSTFEVVGRADQLIHVPYQSYEHAVRFFEEAAEDPSVSEIWLTVYRVARDSKILAALERAARRGVRVQVFFEVQARFDEQTNLRWADRLASAGATTLFGTPDRKVHAKIALIRRQEARGLRSYAYLGTGNFNEVTARFYTDFGLLTADDRLTSEVHHLFRYLAGEIDAPVFQHLLVAPFDLRARLQELIRREANAAASGGTGRIDFKLNALEDSGIIQEVHQAATRGAEVRGIVRGVCCLAPDPALAEQLEIRSIVSRLLEHSRIYRFHAGGEELIYLASADWMSRNLNRRIEVAFPLYDEGVRRQVARVFELQWEERTKVRRIDSDGSSHYAFPQSSGSDPQEAHWQLTHELAGRTQEEAHE